MRCETVRSKRHFSVVLLAVATGEVVDTLEHWPDKRHVEGAQARELRDWLGTALKPFHPLAMAVLFEADYHPRAKLTDGTKTRLRLEGAALTSALDHCRDVRVLDGPGLGRACGKKKEDVVGEAAALSVPDSHYDAAAAAIAALGLVGSR